MQKMLAIAALLAVTASAGFAQTNTTRTGTTKAAHPKMKTTAKAGKSKAASPAAGYKPNAKASSLGETKDTMNSGSGKH